MGIYEEVRKQVINNEAVINRFKFSLMKSLSSLMYVEYMYRTNIEYDSGFAVIKVPSREHIADLVNEGSWKKSFGGHFIESLLNDCNRKYISRPESLFHILYDEQFVDTLKILLEYNIYPSIALNIVELYDVAIKSNLFRGQKYNGSIIEDKSIKMFNDRRYITDTEFRYLVHETMLMMAFIDDTVKKDVIHPKSNMNFGMNDNSILSIGTLFDHNIILIDKCIIQETDKIFDKISYAAALDFTENLSDTEDYSFIFRTTPLTAVGIYTFRDNINIE